MNEFVYSQPNMSIQHQNQYDLEDRQRLMKSNDKLIQPMKIKLEGKKNPNNPRMVLNKLSEVFISKKANYVDCMTCHCCIGENAYKVYKYKYPKDEQRILSTQNNLKIINEGGEEENVQVQRRNSFQISVPNLSNQRRIQPLELVQQTDRNQLGYTGQQQNKQEAIDLGEIERNYLQPNQFVNNEVINRTMPGVINNPYTQATTKQQTTSNLIQAKQKKIKGKRILKIDEDSIMFPKIFCPASCRPYNAYAVSSNGIFEFGRLNREFKLTFLCCERPEILVYRTEFRYDDEEQNLFETFIGKVVNPLCLGQIKVLIYEYSGQQLKQKYDIQGNWFSLANLCQKLGQSVGKMRFAIKDLNNTQNKQKYQKQLTLNQTENLQLGKIVRQYSYFVKECFSKGGHYKVKFPSEATVDQKLLILAGTMLLDMSYFDKKCCFPGLLC